MCTYLWEYMSLCMCVLLSEPLWTSPSQNNNIPHHSISTWTHQREETRGVMSGRRAEVVSRGQRTLKASGFPKGFWIWSEISIPRQAFFWSMNNYNDEKREDLKSTRLMLSYIRMHFPCVSLSMIHMYKFTNVTWWFCSVSQSSGLLTFTPVLSSKMPPFAGSPSPCFLRSCPSFFFSSTFFLSL